jgi:hypothetical protein
MNKLFILFFLLFGLMGYTQNTTKYLYAQVDTNSQFNYPAQYGEIQLQKEKRYKKLILEINESTSPDEAFLEQLSKEFKTLPDGRQNVLFFIHGMMGHHDFYLNLVAKTLDGGLYNQDENKYGMVVYLIWRAGMNYGKNITQTLRMGEEFANLIQNVDERIKQTNNQAEISVLCHSMGNRVFQGIFNKYEAEGYTTPPFKDVILAAADLESNIFTPGQPLEKMGNIAEEIHVYFHEYDRTLMMSQLLNQNNRLGLQGISEIEIIPENIMLIDASFLDDQDNLPGRNSNHRYFFTSPTVRTDLLNLLHNKNGEQLPFRKELDHPRKFALIN